MPKNYHQIPGYICGKENTWNYIHERIPSFSWWTLDELVNQGIVRREGQRPKHYNQDDVDRYIAGLTGTSVNEGTKTQLKKTLLELVAANKLDAEDALKILTSIKM